MGDCYCTTYTFTYHIIHQVNECLADAMQMPFSTALCVIAKTVTGARPQSRKLACLTLSSGVKYDRHGISSMNSLPKRETESP